MSPAPVPPLKRVPTRTVDEVAVEHLNAALARLFDMYSRAKDGDRRRRLEQVYAKVQVALREFKEIQR